MDNTAILTAMEKNHTAHLAWLPSLAGAEVLEGTDLLLVDSGLPTDTFNKLAWKRPDPARPEEGARAAVERFQAKGFPFAWRLGPLSGVDRLEPVLERLGLRRTEEETGMALVLDAIRLDEPRASGLDIRLARNGAAMRDFAAVIAANWTPPDATVLRLYGLSAEAATLPDGPASFLVGYLDGLPVSVTELFVTGAVAGIYNVSTLAAMRRKGFGTALMLAALGLARSRGCRLAVLQAAPDGLGLYRRLGFADVCGYEEYA